MIENNFVLMIHSLTISIFYFLAIYDTATVNTEDRNSNESTHSACSLIKQSKFTFEDDFLTMNTAFSAIESTDIKFFFSRIFFLFHSFRYS